MQVVTRLFVPALVCFLIGVGISAYVSASPVTAGFLLLIATALLSVTMFSPNQMRLLAIGVCALAATLGMLRFILWVESPNDPMLQSSVGKTIVLRGMISDEPDVREKNTQLTLSLNALVGGETNAPVSGKALLIVDRYPEFHYGDVIEIRGQLKIPERFNEDDGRIFDYPNYLKAKGIAYQIFRPRITTLEHDHGNFIKTKLFAWKHAFLDRLSRSLPEPENALAGGILLGGKRSLGAEWTDRFRVVGIVHIIVLSGYNMTIVAEWLGAAFLFLGFYGSLAVSALGIIGFSLMTGAGATVVRAAIMALIVLLARLTARTYTMGRALLVAGVLMVLQNPSILAFDPSFQLSFLAALGLVFLAPLLRRRIHVFRSNKLVEEVVVSTIATQIMVLPLLLYQTGILSTVALFANLLVLPLIPATMLFAFATGLLSFMGYAVAFLPALPTQALLAWMLAVGKYGAALPFAAVHLPPVPGWLVFLAYAAIALLIYRYSRATVPSVPPQALL